jgi:glycosyltransferase involved in cell wall biosynthesis
MKIFLGMIDIANQIGITAHYLTEGGDFARFCLANPNLVGLYQYLSKDWPKYDKYRIGNPGTVEEYDIYDFFFGTTFRATDVVLARKKVLHHFCGSEARQLSISQKHNPYAVAKDPDEEGIRKKLQELAKISPVCTIRDYELYEHLEPYFEKIHIVPRMVEPTEPKFPDGNGCPLVVHAPSNTAIKGTDEIIEAVKELQKTINFKFQLIYKMSHKTAMEILDKADIVIDQLKIGTYGVLSIEAMMRGKPVLCYISDYMRERLPKELPIISATPESIKEAVAAAINDKDDRHDRGAASYQYAMAHHAPAAVVPKLQEVYKSL